MIVKSAKLGIVPNGSPVCYNDVKSSKLGLDALHAVFYARFKQLKFQILWNARRESFSVEEFPRIIDLVNFIYADTSR